MNTEQPNPAPSRSSSKYSSKQPSSSKFQTIAEPSQREVKIADILPVVLCSGILALIYFMMREYNQDKKNTEVHLTSIAKRLEQLETFKGGSVPPVASKEPSKEPSTPARPANLKVQFNGADSKTGEILEPDNKGTFEMKDSVVSFVPNTKPPSKMNDIDEGVSESDSETDTEM